MRDQILEALHHYEGDANTWQIRRTLMLNNADEVRRELFKMESEGLVEVHKGRSCRNLIHWKLPNFNAEAQQ